jgi:hypothetical protein
MRWGDLATALDWKIIAVDTPGFHPRCERRIGPLQNLA